MAAAGCTGRRHGSLAAPVHGGRWQPFSLQGGAEAGEGEGAVIKTSEAPLSGLTQGQAGCGQSWDRTWVLATEPCAWCSQEEGVARHAAAQRQRSVRTGSQEAGRLVRPTHRRCSHRAGGQTPQGDRAALSITGACERGGWPGSQERWLPARLRAWGCRWLVPLYPSSPGLQRLPRSLCPLGNRAPRPPGSRFQNYRLVLRLTAGNTHTRQLWRKNRNERHRE